jgi:glycogen phosphorylase
MKVVNARFRSREAQAPRGLQTRYVGGVLTSSSFEPGAADLAARAELLSDRVSHGLKPLARLAYNYRWSWARDGANVFRDINPHRWSLSGENPVRFLGDLWPSTQAAVERDPSLLARIEALADGVASYLSRPPSPIATDGPIVFFCAEFGFHISMPIYSGGLGVLAGDVLKEASDRGLPMIGIGLFYRHGYFRQRLDLVARQQEYWLVSDPKSLPMARVTAPDGSPLTLEVPLFGQALAFQVWRVDIGRVPLLLLDSQVPENDAVQRWATARLYDGSSAIRLAQYGLLGMGGARLLQAIGVDPGVVHLNDGHAALAPLELAAGEVAKGSTVEDALERARQRTVFTTHTPVIAGNETYSTEEFLAAFGGLQSRLSIDEREFLGLCRVDPERDDEHPGMTPTAIRASSRRNGVSALHGEVARRMWQPMFPGVAVDDVPITHITNGAHVPTFVSDAVFRLLARHFGEDWLENAADPALWEGVRRIPNDELWATRCEARHQLVEFVRAKAQQDRLQRGEQIDYVRALPLDPDALTLGFARRLATYKRLHLLGYDPDRMRSILTGEQRVQIVIAGKAHPSDDGGKDVLQRVYHLKRGSGGVAERVVFLEDYDLAVGQQLVAGCDLWINLPRWAMEASGTSGMKACFNGVLHLGILDGWWAEGYDGSNGWAIESDQSTEFEAADAHDAARFYDLLEQEVVPMFYERDERGVPYRWCERMKEAMVTCGPTFSTTRMLNDYIEQLWTNPAPVHG